MLQIGGVGKTRARVTPRGKLRVRVRVRVGGEGKAHLKSRKSRCSLLQIGDNSFVKIGDRLLNFIKSPLHRLLSCQ